MNLKKLFWLLVVVGAIFTPLYLVFVTGLPLLVVIAIGVVLGCAVLYLRLRRRQRPFETKTITLSDSSLAHLNLNTSSAGIEPQTHQVNGVLADALNISGVGNTFSLATLARVLELLPTEDRSLAQLMKFICPAPLEGPSQPRMPSRFSETDLGRARTTYASSGPLAPTNHFGARGS